jgi:hypothetical protein
MKTYGFAVVRRHQPTPLEPHGWDYLDRDTIAPYPEEADAKGRRLDQYTPDPRVCVVAVVIEAREEPHHQVMLDVYARTREWARRQVASAGATPPPEAPS